MDGIMTGSLITARQTVNIFPIVIIFLSIAILAISIFYITKSVKAYHASAAYIEKQKTRPTTLRDVNLASQEAQLTREERDLLWKICYENAASNIMYLAKEREIFDDLLKSEYYEQRSKNADKHISTLFSLRKKMFSAFTPAATIKHSKNIDVDCRFIYTASGGIHYTLDYNMITSDGMYLTMPKDLVTSDAKPVPLRKIELTFTAKDNDAYRMETRVMRYQKAKDNTWQMVIAHSDRIVPLEKRQSDRVDMTLNVLFGAVKAETKGSKKNPKTTYTVNEKRYPGTLLDISAGGCRLLTKLPIKPQQHIYIEGKFNKIVEDHAIGLILRNTRRKDGMIILHIRFVDIELSVANRIMALACGWDDDQIS